MSRSVADSVFGPPTKANLPLVLSVAGIPVGLVPNGRNRSCEGYDVGTEGYLPSPQQRHLSPMPDDSTLKRILKSQYGASLAMLRASTEACPDALWYDATPKNAFWQVAYHTLFFMHLYLQPDEQAFRPWPGHQANVQHADGIGGDADPGSALPRIPSPYSKSDVLAYCDFCERMLDDAVECLDLESTTSGFYWYPMSKLEHQLVNIRHVQHHAAQLADRLRAHLGIGVSWVGGR